MATLLGKGCPKESITRFEEYGRARLTFVSQPGTDPQKNSFR